MASCKERKKYKFTDSTRLIKVVEVWVAILFKYIEANITLGLFHVP